MICRSALQSLNKIIKMARDNRYIPSGLSHTWTGYYDSTSLRSTRVQISEWWGGIAHWFNLSLILINQAWKNNYPICIFISLIWIHCWQVKFMSSIISLVNFYIQYIKKMLQNHFKVFYRGDSLHARASNLISTYWSTKWCIVPYLYFLLIWNPFFSRYTNEDVEFFKSMPVFVETDE